jgi:ammonia channel protein AmtB
MKEKLHVDDALDVGSVHGVPGIVGALAIGFFASLDVNPQGANGIFYGGGLHFQICLNLHFFSHLNFKFFLILKTNLIYSILGRQLWVQIVGVLATAIWTTIITLPLVWGLKKFKWFSLQPHHEHLGLDGKDHHISAYDALEESENTVVSTVVDEPPRGVVPV